MAVAESGGVPERPVPVTEVLAASAAPADPAVAQAACDWDAGRALGELYAVHYRALVRLAALLVRDMATAEEIVQDSFVAMHANWRRLRDSRKASSYLRQCVVNGSRSVLRHRMVADRYVLQPPPDMPSAEQGAIVLLERSAVVARRPGRHAPTASGRLGDGRDTRGDPAGAGLAGIHLGIAGNGAWARA